MDSRSQLLSLFESLSGSVNKERIIETEYAQYHDELTINYECFGNDFKLAINNHLDGFKCYNCKKFPIVSHGPCKHRLCNQCNNQALNANKCPCGRAMHEETNEIDQKCRQCKNEVDTWNVKCEHFCTKCVQNLSNTGISACEICGYPFETLSYIGQCSNCRIIGHDIFLICQSHSHCRICCKEDLKKLCCCQCQVPLSSRVFSKIYNEANPVCDKCYIYNSIENICLMPCCGKKYCYICIINNSDRRCFCNAKLDDSFTNIGLAANKLFTLIEVLKAGV